MRTLGRIVAIAYLTYLALVILVLTPLLNFLPQYFVKEYLGRQLQADIILFNPFTLSLDARNVALPDPDGTPFFKLQGAAVNLSTASIWHPGIVFDEVSVQGLLVHVKQAADGSFNYDDLIPPPAPEEPAAEPTAIPGITIDHLDFHSETLMFSSRARAKPYSSRLDDLAIEVRGLSTVLEEGKPYRLDARGEGGGELHWEGTVSIPLGTSEGSLSLDNIQLAQAWRFAEPWLNFELREGALSIEGDYRISWLDELAYQVDNAQLLIAAVDLQPKTPGELEDTALTLGELKLSGIAVDGPAQQVDLGTLSVSELAISGWSEGAQVSLAQMFAVDLPAGEEQSPPAEDTDGQDWRVSLQRFQLTDSGVTWRSEFTEPARLEVTPITASAASLQWPPAGDSPLELALTVNGETSLEIGGSLALGEGSGTLAYRLDALPVAWFNPNFPRALKVEITSGTLGVGGDVSLAGFAPTVITASGALEDFSGALADAEESLTSWETVRWDELRVDLEQRSAELARLSIDNYIGRIHINEDGSINAQNAWQAELSDPPPPGGDTPAEQPPAADTEPGQEAWKVSVPVIRITDSEIDFRDESLPITFGTVIGDVNGDITGLSSQADAPTEVDIKGSVDGYAPVVLSGTAQPLRSPPALDLLLSFTGVDMALLSPYSATYAGYAIERGVLDLELKYALEDERLAGNNKILINQMKLGEKVKSDKAADLPLELAVALLTDSNGVIDMEIPVSGNVDDPSFSVGSVVLGAFVNLITKAVTAPFKLLASLVDSEEDLQRINFRSGSAELSAAAKAKLDDLSTALSQRPQLELAITGRLQIAADRERIQKDTLGTELVAAGLSQQELEDKGPLWEEAIQARYRQQLGDAGELTIRDQYLALARQVPLADEVLLELGQARAVAVKTYLVNEKGMAADRAVIGKSNLQEDQNLYSGVELEIEA